MADITRNLTGLSSGTIYEYRITAIGDGATYVDSDPSAVGSFTTLIPLDVPTGLTLTKTTNSITATWTAVQHKSSYRVSYVTGNGSPVVQTVSAESFTLSNIAQGATYSFQVMAVGDGTTYEDSAYCTAVSSTTLIKLGTPQPTVDSTTSQVSVEWPAITHADGYKVWYKTGSGTYGNAIDVGTDRSYVVPGLQEGVTITFKIQAYSNFSTVYEDSEFSAEVSETTQITLAVPTFTLTKTTNSITATWSTVPNAASYVVAYKLNSSSGDFTEVAVNDRTSYTLSELGEGVTYVFKLKSVSNVQDYVDSAYSNTQSTTTLVTLATPSSITVTDITSNSAVINFLGDSNAQSFRLEYRRKGETEWTSLNGD